LIVKKKIFYQFLSDYRGLASPMQINVSSFAFLPDDHYIDL